MHEYLFTAAFTLTCLLLLLALLHLLPRLGPPGKTLSAWLCRAPGLDLLVTLLTVFFPLVAASFHGWRGLLGATTGCYLTLGLWTILHELANPAARKRKRMIHVHNELIGPVTNIALLLWISSGVPVFWLIRVVQLLCYPFLVRFANFPRYTAGDWINVSRHKFPHLVGHDRVWCLYCDWMTGVWSLGSEMLRNVESFWCPVRFAPEAKCDHCKNDFPDLELGWVPFTSDTETAANALREKYVNEPRPPSNAWFGHPVRLTVRGEKKE